MKLVKATWNGITLEFPPSDTDNIYNFPSNEEKLSEWYNFDEKYNNVLTHLINYWKVYKEGIEVEFSNGLAYKSVFEEEKLQSETLTIGGVLYLHWNSESNIPEVGDAYGESFIEFDNLLDSFSYSTYDGDYKNNLPLLLMQTKFGLDIRNYFDTKIFSIINLDTLLYTVTSRTSPGTFLDHFFSYDQLQALNLTQETKVIDLWNRVMPALFGDACTGVTKNGILTPGFKDEFSISMMGTGFKKVLVIVALIAFSNNATILLPDLETGLHPILRNTVLSLIRNSKVGTFIYKSHYK